MNSQQQQQQRCVRSFITAAAEQNGFLHFYVNSRRACVYYIRVNLVLRFENQFTTRIHNIRLVYGNKYF